MTDPVLEGTTTVELPGTGNGTDAEDDEAEPETGKADENADPAVLITGPEAPLLVG